MNIKAFLQRNKGRVLKALIIEIYGRLFLIHGLRTIFTWFHKPANPKKWILLVGCYNSGTTVLTKLLSFHPNISALPREGVRYTKVLTRPEELGWYRNWVYCKDYVEMNPKPEPEKALRIRKDWGPLFNKLKPTFLEKSIANVARMEWLDQNFDNVYFIGIIRNPYPVCEGIQRRAKPQGKAKQQLGSNEYRPSDVANQWLLANQQMMASAEKVKHFKLFRYEELTKDPETQIRNLLEFIQEPAESLVFNGQKIIVEHEPVELVNMNEKSIKRLSSQEISEINKVIAPHINTFGYELINIPGDNSLQ